MPADAHLSETVPDPQVHGRRQLTGNLPDKVSRDVGHFGGMDVEEVRGGVRNPGRRLLVFVISNFRRNTWIFALRVWARLTFSFGASFVSQSVQLPDPCHAQTGVGPLSTGLVRAPFVLRIRHLRQAARHPRAAASSATNATHFSTPDRHHRPGLPNQSPQKCASSNLHSAAYLLSSASPSFFLSLCFLAPRDAFRCCRSPPRKLAPPTTTTRRPPQTTHRATH